MKIYRGIIEGFHGSWGSGLGHLIVSGQAIPCENGPTVRALESCFGNAIGDGHTVNNGEDSGFIGQDIIYSYDEFGLVLGGFTRAVVFENEYGTIPEIGGSMEINLDMDEEEDEDDRTGERDSAEIDHDDPIYQR